MPFPYSTTPQPFTRRVIGALTKGRIPASVTDDRGAYWLITLAERCDNTPAAEHERHCRAAGVDPALVGTVRVSDGRGWVRGLARLLDLGATTRALGHRLRGWLEHRLVAVRDGVLFFFWPHIVALDGHANRDERRRRVPWRWPLDDTGWWSDPGVDPEAGPGQIELPIDPDQIAPSDPQRIGRQLYGSHVAEACEPARAPADRDFEAFVEALLRLTVRNYELTPGGREKLRALVDEHGLGACRRALGDGESIRHPVGWLRAVLTADDGLPPETAIEARVRGCIPVRDGRPPIRRLDAESRAQLARLVEAHGEQLVESLAAEAAGCDLPVQRIHQLLADRERSPRPEPPWKGEWRKKQAEALADRARIRARARARTEFGAGAAGVEPYRPAPEAEPEPVEDAAAAEEWGRRAPMIEANFPSLWLVLARLVAVGIEDGQVVLDGPSCEKAWLTGSVDQLEACGVVVRGVEPLPRPAAPPPQPIPPPPDPEAEQRRRERMAELVAVARAGVAA